MPIPQEQLQRLETDLRAHEKRASALRDQIKKKQDELEAHEAIMALGSDENLISTMNELYDQPDLVRELTDRPEDYFKRKGIKLPPGTEIRVTGNGREETVVEANFKQRSIKYKGIWSWQNGFSVAPLEE